MTMTPEHAVAYIQCLTRRHGFDGMDPHQRLTTIQALRDNPDIIDDFVRRAELNIEQAAARRKGEAA